MPAGLTWVGLVSYSVYLLHPLLLGVYRDTAWSTTSRPAAIQAALAASLVAAVLACSALAHRFVEAPAQRLGRQVNRYLDRRSAPPGPQPAPLRFRPTLILAPAGLPGRERTGQPSRTLTTLSPYGEAHSGQDRQGSLGGRPGHLAAGS